MEINNKIKVSISIIALKEKPNEKDIGRIKNSFEEKECTLSEILHKVINGYSIAPAIFDNNHLSKNTWKEQQRRIEYNGYIFNFNTFENTYMQKIQLQLIEAEIIQAIGRARLIREECEVQLFSNLPIAGAEFVESKVKSGNHKNEGKKVHIKSLKSA